MISGQAFILGHPWCWPSRSACTLLVFTVKFQSEGKYKTYLFHAASGRAIRVLVYLLWHTPSRWGRDSPPPPSISLFLQNPPRLTPLWMPVASGHGGDGSHSPVSGFVFFLMTLPVHSAVTSDHNNYSTQYTYLTLYVPASVSCNWIISFLCFFSQKCKSLG